MRTRRTRHQHPGAQGQKQQDGAGFQCGRSHTLAQLCPRRCANWLLYFLFNPGMRRNQSATKPRHQPRGGHSGLSSLSRQRLRPMRDFLTLSFFYLPTLMKPFRTLRTEASLIGVSRADLRDCKLEGFTTCQGILFVDRLFFIEIQQFYVFRVASFVFDYPFPVTMMKSFSKSETGYGILVFCCYLLL